MGAEMKLNERTIEAFLEEDRILDRVKLEDYLPVALGSRPTGSLMIPVEFPSGEDIRQGIDENYADKFYSGGGRRGLLGFIDKTRLNLQRLVSTPLAFRTGLVRSAFTELVYDHPEYRAHREWAERLGLDTYQKELRPSLDDLFIAASEEAMERISRVMGMRDRIREEAQKRQDMSPVFLPEEMSSIFLDAVGGMLGYPRCCVEAYIEDANRGVDSGVRASEQLENSPGDAEGAAYFASYFYPCTPGCPEAVSLGRDIRGRLGDLRLGLDEMSAHYQGENMQFVRDYRDMVRQKQREMMAKMEEVRSDGIPE